MPKVPVFESQTRLITQGPSVLVDTKSYGVEGRALAQMWEDQGKAGKELTDVGLKLQKGITEQEEGQDYATRLLSLNRNLRDFAEGIKQIDNPNDRLVAFQRDAQTSLEAHLEGASPRVSKLLGLHAAKEIPSLESKVRKEAQDYRISNLKGNLPGQLDEAVQGVVDAPNELSAITTQGTFLGTLRAAASPESGYLTPQQAAEWENKFHDGVKVARYKKNLLQDPVATLQALEQPGAFEFNDTQRAQARRETTAEVHRVQNENYSQYMKGILVQTGNTANADLQLPSLEQVKGDIEGNRLNPHQARDIIAYVEGVKGNPERKTDPRSYKEAVTRLTDQDDPLTREEFLNNVKSGDWKLDAKTYGQFLVNIGTRGGKLEKAGESAFKARVNFWKTQFGMDPKGDQIMTALGQAQAAKDAGELGSTPEEINKNLDAIFAPQHQLYMQEWNLGSFKPSSKAKQTWGDWFRGRQPGSEPGPAKTPGTPAPETVTKDGKRYRVKTVNGRKMVDPTPLP